MQLICRLPAATRPRWRQGPRHLLQRTQDIPVDSFVDLGLQLRLPHERRKHEDHVRGLDLRSSLFCHDLAPEILILLEWTRFRFARPHYPTNERSTCRGPRCRVIGLPVPCGQALAQILDDRRIRLDDEVPGRVQRQRGPNLTHPAVKVL